MPKKDGMEAWKKKRRDDPIDEINIRRGIRWYNDTKQCD